MKILIADDDENSRIFLERALASQGYEVDSAPNGVIALEKAQASPPDLIISDILMPEMNGFELCRHIKTDPRLHTIPFVFYSATFVDERDEQLGLSLGASRFLVKPMEPEAFFHVINEVIDEYRAQQLPTPESPLVEEPTLAHMQAEALARKLDKKVRELEAAVARAQASEERVRLTLEAADRAKNQFLMSLSHEFKTPLTNIIGWAQLAQTTPDIVPQALRIILRNADKQQEMLERLLILSHILTGKLSLSRRTVDLWQLAQLTVRGFRQAAEERGITLTFTPPLEDLPVDGDVKMLSQVLCEVVENAVKYTPTGGAVTLQGRREDHHVILVVTDTGRGIAPEQLPTLLQPFTQIQRKEEMGGLGIGLAIVRGIIEAHYGQVEITSPGLGHGTTVTISLPMPAQETTA